MPRSYEGGRTVIDDLKLMEVKYQREVERLTHDLEEMRSNLQLSEDNISSFEKYQLQTAIRNVQEKLTKARRNLASVRIDLDRFIRIRERYN